MWLWLQAVADGRKCMGMAFHCVEMQHLNATGTAWAKQLIWVGGTRDCCYNAPPLHGVLLPHSGLPVKEDCADQPQSQSTRYACGMHARCPATKGRSASRAPSAP